MRTRSLALTSLAALALTGLPACDEEMDSEPATDEAPLRGGMSGPPTNTWKIFTSEISNVDTLGDELGGVELIDVQITNGLGLYYSIDPGTLTVVGGELQAEINGLTFTGTQFEGSLWSFTKDGIALQAELTEVETAVAAGLFVPSAVPDLRRLDPDRLVYTFMWTDGVNEFATCDHDSIGGARTVIFGDFVVDHVTGDITARPDTLYLGCISGAVGKAALWGYAPDNPIQPSIPLPAFMTATRMVRADYCGDGVPHTIVGNEVTMKDRWGINDITWPGFFTEAVWEAGGAAKCIKQFRETGAVVVAPYVCPDRQIPVCGTDAALQTRWDDHKYGDFWSNIP